MHKIKQSMRCLAASLLVFAAAVDADAATLSTGTTLSDAPLYSSIIVPANVILALSVEFPTADSDAYYYYTTYTTASTYIGYYNPNFCYQYVANTAYTGTTYGTGSNQIVFGSLAGYFAPKAAAGADSGDANTHTCSGYWSGNFLNWATTQTIDPLRRALTGGARIVDTSSTTILQKAYEDSQAGTSNQNVKSITSSSAGSTAAATTLIAGATPFSNWTSFYVNNLNTGLNFVFSQNALSSGTKTGTSLAGINITTLLNNTLCANGGTGTSTTGGGSSPSSNSFGMTATPSVISLTQGCTNNSSIAVTYGNSYNKTITFSVNYGTGCTGVTNSTLSSTAGSGTSGQTTTQALTFTASSSAVGVCTVTVKASPSSGSSQSVTIALTVIPINTTASTAVYSAQGAVQVCTSVDAPSDLEGNGGRCRGYPYNVATTSSYQSGLIYKPFGLMQQYAAENGTGIDSIRYAMAGYMLDPNGDTPNAQLDAGVLRAKMKSVGPYQANPGSAVVSNTYSEWNNTTGQFYQNPNATDASSTPSATGSTPKYSGVSNYLNLFGFVNPNITYSSTSASAAYKTYDSVSELYYTANRYYRKLGNLYYNTGGAGTGSTVATAITNGSATNDNFPVITTWDDPIAYSCSTNYIIGIGDEHTWNDGDVPGSTLNGGYEQNLSNINNSDAAVNATTATNYIANLEHVAGYTGAGTIPGTTANNGYDYIQSTGLGGTFLSSSSSGNCCTGATFYLAGLAFDSHVRDIRTDITTKAAPVTVSTYWLDVMEANDYHEKNVYWMAAKYGGFRTNDTSFGVNGYPIFEPPTYSASSPPTAVATGSSAALATYSTTLANTPLALTSWSSTATSSGTTVPTNLDEYNNVEPDNYYEAGNGAAMTAGLNAAFKSITSQVPAGTSTALDLGSATVNTTTSGANINYVANYASDWSGDVAAETIGVTSSSTSGGVSSLSNTTTLWDARWWLPPSAAGASGVPSTVQPLSFAAGTGGRVIATSKARGAGQGVPFEVGSLSSTELTTLGSTSNLQSNVLNYVRGDQCNEIAVGSALASSCQTITGNSTSLGFRARKTTVLGDIVDSSPQVVGPPSSLYSDTPLNPGYTNFVSSNSSRRSMLYVGANDGMLHAFDATVTCTTSGTSTTCASGTTGGEELFAYVPSYLFNTNVDSQNNPVGLASLTVSPLVHHFMVDASPMVGDVDFSRVNQAEAGWTTTVPSTTSNWHTILVSGLGKGGTGFFALDVTNPTGNTSESALAGNVLWETDPTTSAYSDMGYSYGKPRLIKTLKYGWTLVLTSGYDNPTGAGHIYLVNPQTGSVLQQINTNAGTSAAPSGLTYVTAYINNFYDGTADSLYAGDLLGNLWRVDLTCNDTAGNCATSTEFGTVTKFATLTDSSGAAQPVTTEPIVTTDPSSTTRYVFVGTGRLLADTDLVSTQTQTFYALIDGTASAFNTTASFPLTTSNLANDTTTDGSGNTTPLSGGVTLTSSQLGFYFNLNAAATNGSGTQASAERINVQPVAVNGVVAFAANLYGQNICIKGSSREFVLNYDSGSGSGLGQSVLYGTANTTSVVGYIANPIGVVTNLGIASSTPPGSSVASGLSLLVGLDTTSGGAKQNAQSGVQAITLNAKKAKVLTRLNWRQVPESQ